MFIPSFDATDADSVAPLRSTGNMRVDGALRLALRFAHGAVMSEAGWKRVIDAAQLSEPEARLLLEFAPSFGLAIPGGLESERRHEPSAGNARVANHRPTTAGTRAATARQEGAPKATDRLEGKARTVTSVELSDAVAAAVRVIEDDRYTDRPWKRILTAEEELGLAHLIRDGRALDVDLPEDFPNTLEPGSPSKMAWECMVVHNLGLVHSIATKLPLPEGMEYEDLVQYGVLGIMRAVRKFDASKGYKFSTYATWWVRQSLSRSIADFGSLIRIPVHMHETCNSVRQAQRSLFERGLPSGPAEIALVLDLSPSKVMEALKLSKVTASLDVIVGEDASLGDFLAPTDHLPPFEDQVHREMDARELYRLLKLLPEKRSIEVLALRFGLLDGEEWTLEQIGNRVGVTRERIRQLEGKALTQLRQIAGRQAARRTPQPEATPKVKPLGKPTARKKMVASKARVARTNSSIPTTTDGKLVRGSGRQQEARSYLQALAAALTRRGVSTSLTSSIDEPALTVSKPSKAIIATAGRIEASVANGRFVWGAGRFRSTHPIKDTEGAAYAIARSGRGSNPVQPRGVHRSSTPTTPAGSATSRHVHTDSEALARLVELAGALSQLGIDVALEPENLVLAVNGPAAVVERTAGQVRVLTSSARYVWGVRISRDSHPVADHYGAAKKISEESLISLRSESERLLPKEATRTDAAASRATAQDDRATQKTAPDSGANSLSRNTGQATPNESAQTTRADPTLGLRVHERQASTPEPPRIAISTDGWIEASINSSMSAWDGGDTHTIKDPEGGAFRRSNDNSSESGHYATNGTAAVSHSSGNHKKDSRGVCPIPLGRAIATYTDNELIALALWIKSDGRRRSENDLVRDITSELKLSAHASTWAIHRVKDIVRAAQQRDGGSTDLPSNTGTHGRRTSDDRARSYLRSLADALARRGVRASLASDEATLMVEAPGDVVSRTAGRVDVSMADLQFAWGSNVFRMTHSIQDHDGAARMISGRGIRSSPQGDARRELPTAKASPTKKPERPLFLRSGSRPITAYESDELMAVIRWLWGDGRALTYDDLIDNVLSELGLPGRTRRRVQLIEEAATLAGWRASATDAADGSFRSGGPQYKDVVQWARKQRYEFGPGKAIPEHVVYQYNLAHPAQPYTPRQQSSR
ncbi:hypothetical protein GCM10023194_74740 [Planotetraspora phitsanulokensis]|uniref:RNA polymerase sigma-70 domain-containing protein n=1 Tax=Planotetraspora phitsanulokensis TaxID=575192 RepID=A0A8J3XE41_9ACTN|nr:sigma-70 family RNA polymerase sigma factor [Planotetraspora phitsanulokensis]GII37026.1 hypothetical protein Pph01_20290 [Planotetraspora phitsanulokensis]